MPVGSSCRRGGLTAGEPVQICGGSVRRAGGDRCGDEPPVRIEPDRAGRRDSSATAFSKDFPIRPVAGFPPSARWAIRPIRG